MHCSYYGHLSQRFCNINRTYQELFEQCFSKQYGLIHRLETNKLRNVARLFAVSAAPTSHHARCACSPSKPCCFLCASKYSCTTMNCCFEAFCKTVGFECWPRHLL